MSEWRNEDMCKDPHTRHEAKEAKPTIATSNFKNKKKPDTQRVPIQPWLGDWTRELQLPSLANNMAGQGKAGNTPKGTTLKGMPEKAQPKKANSQNPVK